MVSQSAGTGAVTRGGLVPAQIENLSNGDVVHFMFNPSEYSLSKSNSWEVKAKIGVNVPQVTFQKGGAMSLSLTLHFDSSLKNSDVRDHTDPLWQMMLVDKSKENPQSGKSSPPPVAFSWGGLYFKAVITQLSQKFTLFDKDGIPLRCEVSISLQQYRDESDPDPQTAQDLRGAGAPGTATVRQGDRLDNIAANTNGGSPDYRPLAEANNIDNPMKLRNGQQIRTRNGN